jgi:hypothetical protein
MADLPVGGGIDPGSFPFLVADLHRKGATGSLKVAGPSYQKALYFRSGRILFGSSNDPRDQLGAILIESGKITPEQLDDVSAKVGPGSPLAKVLTDTGFVNQRELSEAARAKVERILSDVMAYSEGSFEFEDGVLPKGAVDLKLSTERVIVAAVRRIADRNFVLRYIDGMEAVLRPTGDMASRAAEIETDTSGVTMYLDGARALKEAASLARLDEFEAAKIACALLFLGMVDKVAMVDLGALAAAAQAAPVQAAPAPAAGDVPFMIDAETPAAVIGMEPSTSEPGTIRMEPESPPLTAEPAVEPIRMEAPDGPVVMMEPEPTPLTAAEPTVMMAPEPPPPEPPAFVMPPARETPHRRVYDVPPLVPPPPRPEPPPAPIAATPPTAEELKALDELLNPKLAGPRAALDRAEDARQERARAAPPPPRAARRPPPSSSRLPLVLGLAAVVAVAAAAGWFFVLKPKETATAARADAPPARGPATTLAAPPPSTLAPATAPPAPPAADDARGLLAQGNYPEAGRLFAAELRAAGPGAATVQLFISCAPETIAKAVGAVGTETLVILPTRFNGRDCYRMCWGIHPSSTRAVTSLRSLPEYFRQGGVAPKVVPASEIAP